jgi:hypothetical protein
MLVHNPSNQSQGMRFNALCITLFSCRMALVLFVSEEAGTLANQRRINALLFVDHHSTGQP